MSLPHDTRFWSVSVKSHELFYMAAVGRGYRVTEQPEEAALLL